MMKHTNPALASEEQIRVVLERYKCPVPFHAVRTRFLGNIATPIMSASPIKTVEDLWGGELPEFDSVDATRELIGALVMGLWNRLSRHQDRNSPFRLMRTDSAPTREGLAAFALMRQQELDGFIDGLFGREEVVDLPERASRGLDVLSGMRTIFAAVLHTARDETKAETDKDRETKLQHMREMTKNAEREMHAIVLSCKRARKRLLSALPSKKPSFH